jgi:hypothetical protein
MLFKGKYSGVLRSRRLSCPVKRMSAMIGIILGRGGPFEVHSIIPWAREEGFTQ